MKIERRGLFRIVDEREVEAMKSAVEKGRKGAVTMKQRTHRETGDFFAPERRDKSKENACNTDFLFLSERSSDTRQMSQRKRQCILLLGFRKQTVPPLHPSRRSSANRFEYQCISQPTGWYGGLPVDIGEDDRVRWDRRWNRRTATRQTPPPRLSAFESLRSQLSRMKTGNTESNIATVTNGSEKSLCETNRHEDRR